MLGIVKRILNSRTTMITTDDLQFINTYLDDSGKFLFFQMEKIDKLHALAVARAVSFETEFNSGVNRKKLIRAALLHDIGKVDGDFNLWSRIAVGIIRRLHPSLRGKLALTQPRNPWQRIRYSFYVDLVHPARGAHMASIFGIEAEVVELIRQHHDPPRIGQNQELTWLQMADNRN